MIISFRGRQQSGKSAAAEYFEQKYGFVRVSFADPLRDLLKRITPDGNIDKERDRKLMQYVGTEYYRERVNQNHWIDLWDEKVTKLLAQGRRVAVDDARFDNEIDHIVNRGHKHVYIVRPEHPPAYPEITFSLTHRSEQNNDPCDHRHYTVIGNFGTLEQFHDLLDGLAKTLLDAPKS